MKTYPTNAERKAAKAAKAIEARKSMVTISTTSEERAAMRFESAPILEVDYNESVKCQEYFEQQLQNQKNTIR